MKAAGADLPDFGGPWFNNVIQRRRASGTVNRNFSAAVPAREDIFFTRILETSPNSPTATSPPHRRPACANREEYAAHRSPTRCQRLPLRGQHLRESTSIDMPRQQRHAPDPDRSRQTGLRPPIGPLSLRTTRTCSWPAAACRPTVRHSPLRVMAQRRPAAGSPPRRVAAARVQEIDTATSFLDPERSGCGSSRPTKPVADKQRAVGPLCRQRMRRTKLLARTCCRHSLAPLKPFQCR